MYFLKKKSINIHNVIIFLLIIIFKKIYMMKVFFLYKKVQLLNYQERFVLREEDNLLHDEKFNQYCVKK
jgi:hypothetical protein